MTLSAKRLAIMLGMMAASAQLAGVQAHSGLPSWIPSQWEAGGMVITTPLYEGSRSNRVIGVPVIFPSIAPDALGGTVQFKGIDDVRLRLVTFKGFEAGPVAGYRFGREEDDARRLRGLGDVDGGLVLGGYAAYRLGSVTAFASYNHQATGEETGGLLKLGVEGRAQVQPGLLLTAIAGTTWSSSDYMRAYFGVTAAQSARSGLAAYRPEAGIKDVFVGLGAEVHLSESWRLRASTRYSHLVGDAADSPIVEREGQWSGMLGLTYRLSIR